jgi:hypothetical protein
MRPREIVRDRILSRSDWVFSAFFFACSRLASARD